MLLSVAVMLVVVFARAAGPALPGLGWLAPVGRLAWPWYVPAGTALTILAGWTLERASSR